jgi:ubiquinone/menaquinone biosynthesis C-methylase UbiE
MATDFTLREVSEKYDRFAPWYDLVEGIPDLLGLRKLRRQLLQNASGSILEIAIGTGKNLGFYRPGSTVVALDLSDEMLHVARKRAQALAVNTAFLRADAAHLPFTSRNFDTVMSSLSSCTFRDPVEALREIGRVCKPGGRILLLEHGRSDREWLARFQDRHADQFAIPLGCHWNRRPQELVREAGLEILNAQRFIFGVFHLIEAKRLSISSCEKS